MISPNAYVGVKSFSRSLSRYHSDNDLELGGEAPQELM